MQRLVAVVFVCVAVAAASAQEKNKDRRLAKPADYNGHYEPWVEKPKPLPYMWTPPASKEAWAVRRDQVRKQVLVANGLWPMPEKTPLKPTIHGKIERDGYTIEHVFFASYPGHYVTGNLYRPTGASLRKSADGKLPAVLSPHGHWANGRFYQAGDGDIKKQLQTGAEQTEAGARYPLQARCAMLARLGCIVFHYDMVGYADSQQIPHRQGFLDPAAELWLQSFTGLQTWNTIRALDFLLSLPDVDPQRVGVTGASGGGTQTFMLCAIDDRPAAAFPAVMVSTGMQGGCICENCSYLRIGTGNIELAALWAPRPLGMAAADDWTRDIEQRGLPELKALYRLLGAPDNIMAKAYLQFPHNYNQPSRELMYNFFNKHLKLGHAEPIKEQPFEPVPPKQLSVFDAEHPLPKDAVDAKQLRAYLTKVSQQQLQSLKPKDAAGLDKFRHFIGAALESIIVDRLPAPEEVEVVDQDEGQETDAVRMRTFVLSRKGRGEAVRALGVMPANNKGTGIIWVHPDGIASVSKDGKFTPDARKALDAGAAILAVEPLLVGPGSAGKTLPINKGYAGYTFGYNRPLMAERVHDILTAVGFAQTHTEIKRVHLVGFGKAGPWTALARGLCGDKIARTAVDLDNFSFTQVDSMDHPNMLPGGLKYGDVPTLTALTAPHELLVHNTSKCQHVDMLDAAYNAAGKSNNLTREEAALPSGRVLEWLLR